MAAAGVLAASVMCAQAAPPSSSNDALAGPTPKISLAAAVATAEQHAKGKARHAEFERTRQGQWVYDIEVSDGTKVIDVRVDAETGTVLTSLDDTADADDGQDKED